MSGNIRNNTIVLGTIVIIIAILLIAANTASTTDIVGDVDITGDLNVTGDGTFDGDLNITGDLNVFIDDYGTDYGAVLVMNFEEGTGTTAFDQSPYGNDGVFPAKPDTPTWADGKFGEALTFDGTDYVTISNSESLNVSTNITIEAWAKDPPNWYDSAWKYRLKITFDNSASTENLVNFPVLVNLSASVFSFSDALASGNDLRFVDSDNTTLLSHDAEDYDSGAQEATIWVNVPQIDATSTTDHIWMYYGNADASSAEDIDGTWNTDFIMVHHLPDENTSAVLDSTQYNRDGVKSGANEPIEATGYFAMAQKFDGTNDLITTGAVDTFSAFTDGTVEFWANVSEGGDVFLVFKDTSNYVSVQVSSSDLQIRARIGGTTQYLGSTTANTFTYDSFCYGVWTKSGSTHTFYINGVNTAITWSDQTDESAYFDDVPTAASGFIAKAMVTNWANGTIDELRVSNSSRSAEWIEAQYLSMTDDFITYGSEENVVDKIIVEKADSYLLGITDTSILVGMINTTDCTYTITDVTEWHYYAMTYDASNIRLYIDGVLVNTTVCTGTIEVNTNDILIGTRFLGEIDQVRIYSVTKTVGEIRNHYLNSGLTYSGSTIVSDNFRILNSTLNKQLGLDEDGNLVIGGTINGRDINGTYSKTLAMDADKFGRPNVNPPTLVDQDNVQLWAFTLDTDKVYFKFPVPYDYASGLMYFNITWTNDGGADDDGLAVKWQFDYQIASSGEAISGSHANSPKTTEDTYSGATGWIETHTNTLTIASADFSGADCFFIKLSAITPVGAPLSCEPHLVGVCYTYTAYNVMSD